MRNRSELRQATRTFEAAVKTAKAKSASAMMSAAMNAVASASASLAKAAADLEYGYEDDDKPPHTTMFSDFLRSVQDSRDDVKAAVKAVQQADRSLNKTRGSMPTDHALRNWDKDKHDWK